MKTTLLCAAFLIAAAFSSNAQNRSAGTIPSSLEKGSLLLGTNGSGSFSSGRIGTNRAFLAAPWAGYLVHDKLVTGLSVSFSNEKFTSKDIDMLPDQDHANVSPELFARYYVFSGKLKSFAELGAGYNFLISDGSKTNNAYLSPAIGLSYWLGQRVALEANYKFKLQSEKMKQMDPASDLKFRFGISVGIR